MMELWSLIAFLPAALMLNLTPGADMMFCLGQGMRVGARPAVAASAGVALGGLIHCLVAGLGLSALISAFPWAFDLIRWIGVSYLVWLAVQALRSSGLAQNQAGSGAAQAFRQGLIVNLTNPKVILFVLAFLPQFVDPAYAVLPQFLIFGSILSFGGFIINGLVGVFAGTLGARLASSQRFAKWLGRISAGIFGALALKLALTSKG